jgi:hypothetical protein
MGSAKTIQKLIIHPIYRIAGHHEENEIIIFNNIEIDIPICGKCISLLFFVPNND